MDYVFSEANAVPIPSSSYGQPAFRKCVFCAPPSAPVIVDRRAVLQAGARGDRATPASISGTTGLMLKIRGLPSRQASLPLRNRILPVREAISPVRNTSSPLRETISPVRPASPPWREAITLLRGTISLLRGAISPVRNPQSPSRNPMLRLCCEYARSRSRTARRCRPGCAAAPLPVRPGRASGRRSHHNRVCGRQPASGRRGPG